MSVVNFFVVAGVPSFVYDEFTREPCQNIFGEEGMLISAPLPPGTDGQFRYSESYANTLFRKFCVTAAPIVSKDLATELKAGLVILNYAVGTNWVVNKFFPLTLNIFVSDPGFGRRMSWKRRRQLKNTLVQSINVHARKSRAHFGAIHRTLTSDRAKTPLLLPLTNFSSDHLESTLKGLANDFSQSAAPQDTLIKIHERFSRYHHPKPVNGSAQRFFCDRRGLHYVAPPERYAHALPRHQPGDHHLETCILRARLRLGRSYSASFHYDCCYESARINEQFPNCHGEAVKVKNRKHVNIAPNDWIR